MNALKIMMMSVLLFGWASGKSLTQFNENLSSAYVKLTIEPMMFDQYKNAHPELHGLDCGTDKFFDK